MDFIFKHLRKPDGRLFKRYRNGESGINSHLDDYAFMVWGLIELYESTAKPTYLREAISLTYIMITDFWDHDQKGFYLASATATDLIIRNKECYDGAYPSGNSVAVHNLIRLGRMTGNNKWLDMAQQIGNYFSISIQRAPTGFTHYLSAYMMLIQSCADFIITGNPESTDYQEMASTIQKIYLPGKTIVYRDDRNPDDAYELIPDLREYPLYQDGVKCYICRDQTCGPPIESVEEVRRLEKTDEL